MKYEKVTIEGNEYYKVPEHDVDAFICDKCHFHDQPYGCFCPDIEATKSCYINDVLYLYMTEAELAKENILKKEEKLRNID